MIEKDNDFVIKKNQTFKKRKLLHSPGTIKSLCFDLACNTFTEHYLCEKAQIMSPRLRSI